MDRVRVVLCVFQRCVVFDMSPLCVCVCVLCLESPSCVFVCVYMLSYPVLSPHQCFSQLA